MCHDTRHSAGSNRRDSSGFVLIAELLACFGCTECEEDSSGSWDCIPMTGEGCDEGAAAA